MTTDYAGGFGPLITRSGRTASQQPLELARFIEILNIFNARSYLEIGARHGDTFFDVVRSLPIGSRAVAVDMPAGPWGSSKSRSALCECIAELVALGYDASAVFGDSQEVVIDGVFDAVLIDADHRYEAVKADYERWGNSGIVAFHDIDGDGLMLNGMQMGVPRLWREIRNGFDHEEIIKPSDDRKMGIGVLFK